MIDSIFRFKSVEWDKDSTDPENPNEPNPVDQSKEMVVYLDSSQTTHRSSSFNSDDSIESDQSSIHSSFQPGWAKKEDLSHIDEEIEVSQFSASSQGTSSGSRKIRAYSAESNPSEDSGDITSQSNAQSVPNSTMRSANDKRSPVQEGLIPILRNKVEGDISTEKGVELDNKNEKKLQADMKKGESGEKEDGDAAQEDPELEPYMEQNSSSEEHRQSNEPDNNSSLPSSIDDKDETNNNLELEDSSEVKSDSLGASEDKERQQEPSNPPVSNKDSENITPSAKVEEEGQKESNKSDRSIKDKDFVVVPDTEDLKQEKTPEKTPTKIEEKVINEDGLDSENKPDSSPIK